MPRRTINNGWHGLAAACPCVLRPNAVAMLAVCASAWISGCQSQKPESAAPTDAVTKTASDGPVTLSLTATRTDFDYTSHAEVQIEAKAKQGGNVHLEDYRDTLREAELTFEIRVVDARRNRSEPDPDGTVIETARYTLAFVLPGEYELPPASASFSADSTPGAELRRVSTEGISILARDPANRQVTQEEMATITVLDPKELPTLLSRWWWFIPIAAATLAVVLLLTVPRLRRWLRRRLLERPKPTPPPIPADIWARQQLVALMEEHLLDRGLLQEFHYRISYIVRGYIERRYGVTASEMTTEEFLSAAIADARFGPDITVELQRFLAACDLVKYARHEPSTDESSGALSAAESFVERTRGHGPDPTAPAISPHGDQERSE